MFETGRAWGFNNKNYVEDQRHLVEKLKPDYLLMLSSCLEFLSLEKPSIGVREKLREGSGTVYDWMHFGLGGQGSS